MAQEKKYDVFISYSRKDFDEVNTFVEMLKRRIPTLDIWFDLTGIESGDEFRDKIISAIKRSQYVLFALSINSDQSKWTRKELQFASGKGKKIVPILLKGSKLEDMDWFLFEFGGVSYVDITDSKQIEQLIKNLASWTGKAIHSNQLKVETDEPVSLGSVQELQEQIAQAEAEKKALEEKMRLAEEKVRQTEEKARIEERKIAEERSRKTEEKLHQVEKRLKIARESKQCFDLVSAEIKKDDKKSNDNLNNISLHKAAEFFGKALDLSLIGNNSIEGENKQSESNESSLQPISVNGVSFNMVKVQGGTFTIGATPEQESENPWDDERPAHEVAVTDYMIGETAVTQALWEAVMGVSIQEQCKKGTLGSSLRGVGANYPMYHISWNDCQDFVTRLSQLTGKTFRLPTEAEWEFAARGGNQCKGFKYAGSDTLGDVAWYDDGQTFETSPVAQKQPNELGLYDMSGNVWEWCQDWYINYGVELTPAMLKSAGMSHVTRGGSWNRAPRFCRVSVRGHSTPNERVNYVGLRVVMEIE